MERRGEMGDGEERRGGGRGEGGGGERKSITLYFPSSSTLHFPPPPPPSPLPPPQLETSGKKELQGIHVWMPLLGSHWQFLGPCSKQLAYVSELERERDEEQFTSNQHQ